MIDAAAHSGATLAVGHTERYNPAITTAMPLITAPQFVEVHRLAAFPGRSLDIDVVFDLMIHDLGRRAGGRRTRSQSRSKRLASRF